MAVRKSTVSDNYGGIGTAQPGWKGFPWSPKRNVFSHLILTFRIFCWQIPDSFLRAELSVSMMGSDTCYQEPAGFLKRAPTAGLPPEFTIRASSPPLDEDCPLEGRVVVPSFAHRLSRSTWFSNSKDSCSTHTHTHTVWKWNVFLTFQWRTTCGNPV